MVRFAKFRSWDDLSQNFFYFQGGLYYKLDKGKIN